LFIHINTERFNDLSIRKSTLLMKKIPNQLFTANFMNHAVLITDADLVNDKNVTRGFQGSILGHDNTQSSRRKLKFHRN